MFVLQEDNFSDISYELLQNPSEGSLRKFSDYITEVRCLELHTVIMRQTKFEVQSAQLAVIISSNKRG